MPRRIKAARQLAGFSTVKQLTDRLPDGLGEKTLRSMESGARTVRRHELLAIAEACGLPVEFFLIDYDDIAQLSPPPLDIDHDADEIANLVGRLRSIFEDANWSDKRQRDFFDAMEKGRNLTPAQERVIGEASSLINAAVAADRAEDDAATAPEGRPTPARVGAGPRSSPR